MRLEQRIGRVDRIGQRRTVHAVHFIAKDSVESRILNRLRDRVARARHDIGAPDPVGLDDERAVARFAIGAAADVATVGTSVAPPALDVPDLQLDAVCEAARIGASRARAVDLDAAQGALLRSMPAWVANSRRRATREALAGRTLLIYEATMEDGLGGIAESMLVPVMCSPRIAATALDNAAVSHERNVAARVERALRPWREQARCTHLAFTSRRLARERAIAGVGDRRISAYSTGAVRSPCRDWERASRCRTSGGDRRTKRTHRPDRAVGPRRSPGRAAAVGPHVLAMLPGFGGHLISELFLERQILEGNAIR